MKNKGFIIGVVALAVLIAVAAFGYSYLSKDYSPEENISTEATKKPLKPAADFEVYDYDGNPVKLSDFKGKPVVVNFWATWCGPCRSELPAFEKLSLEYADRVEFMMINLTDGVQETKEGVKAFVSENGFSFPVYYDTTSDAAYAHEIYSIPKSLFIDAQGNIVNKYVGAMSEESLRKYIEKLLNY